MIDLSVIIVSFNTKDLLVSCIKSVKRNLSGLKSEIIVVDNASEDTSAESAEFLGAKVIRNKKNLGFAAANNQGIRVSNGKYILFLNSDTLISEPIFKDMIKWMDEHKNVGVVTCSLKNKDGSIQATGGFFPTLIRVFSWMTIQDIPYVDLVIKPFHPMHSRSFFAKGADFYKKTRELDWVTGAFLLTRMDVLEKVKGWDEKYFMYVEEVDLCYRIKKLGYKVWYLPKWSIIHFGGASGAKGFSLIAEIDGVKRFYKKFFPPWQVPILRFLLKLGAFGRIIVFGVIEGPKASKTYAKIFVSA